MSSNWKDRLFDYKADPPPSAWEAIAAGLDKGETSFPKKLYNYEAQPPATAWQAIEAQLPATRGAKVVPMRSKMLRYAAAAVVLLAIASIAYFTTLTKSNNETAVATTIDNSLLSTIPALPPANREVTHYNVPPQPAYKTREETDTKQKEARSPQYSMAAASLRNIAPRKQAQTNLSVEPSFATGLAVVPQEKNIINTDRADRYMIATSESGEPVRLPKKVYSAFACPEDDPRHQACELRLTLLQQKMSSSITTDFVQFLDLLMNLQEN